MIIKSLKPKVNIPDITIFQLLFKDNRIITDSSKPCFLDAEDNSQMITFADLENLILRFVAGFNLRFPNFALGDVVALYTPNQVYYPAVLHGIICAGGAVASIDHSSDVRELVECLETVEAKIIIAHTETVERAKDAAKILGIPTSNIFLLDNNEYQGVQSVHSAMWNHSELGTPVTPSKEELSTIPSFFYYTSGTTGKKKTVATTQNNIIGWLVNLPKEHSSATRILCHTEFHHASSLMFTMLLYVMNGYTMYILKKFTFEKYFLAIQQNKINIISIQPWIAAIISKDDTLVNQDTLLSVKIAYCSGSPSSKNLCQLFFKKFNIFLINMYGMTETMHPLENDFEKSLEGYAGSLSPGVSCKLINEDGKEVGYNEEGELWIKESTKKLGYYKNPKANAKVFDQDGFFRTGDIFMINKEGNLTHVDRINDIIKYKYEKIAPQEIEIVLSSHPLVVSCAVVGWLDPEENTFLVRAFVSLKNHDQDLNQVKQEIIEITKAQLSDFKQLRGGLFIVKDLPRNNTGKINRPLLRQYNVGSNIKEITVLA